jgi:hypothetical protein
MERKNIDPDNILKIFFDFDHPTGDGGMIFKKYNQGGPFQN